MLSMNTIEEPFSILNYSVLWWVLVGTFIVVIIFFYTLTLHLTRPLKGEDDDIFTKKIDKSIRNMYLVKLKTLQDKVVKNETTLTEAVEQLYSITQGFIIAKSRTDMTGLTLNDLKTGKAPQPVIDIYEEIYSVIYRPSTQNKAIPFFELLNRVESMVISWR